MRRCVGAPPLKRPSRRRVFIYAAKTTPSRARPSGQSLVAAPAETSYASPPLKATVAAAGARPRGRVEPDGHRATGVGPAVGRSWAARKRLTASRYDSGDTYERSA
jgi:hypothetical protein